MYADGPPFAFPAERLSIFQAACKGMTVEDTIRRYRARTLAACFLKGFHRSSPGEKGVTMEFHSAHYGVEGMYSTSGVCQRKSTGEHSLGAPDVSLSDTRALEASVLSLGAFETRLLSSVEARYCLVTTQYYEIVLGFSSVSVLQNVIFHLLK